MFYYNIINLYRISLLLRLIFTFLPSSNIIRLLYVKKSLQNQQFHFPMIPKNTYKISMSSGNGWRAYSRPELVPSPYCSTTLNVHPFQVIYLRSSASTLSRTSNNDVTNPPFLVRSPTFRVTPGKFAHSSRLCAENRSSNYHCMSFNRMRKHYSKYV